MQEIKIILAGDGGTGKTTWVNKLLGLPFLPQYNATEEISAHPVNVNLVSGDNCTVNLWDYAGQLKFCGSMEGYLVGADAAIVTFEGGSKLSQRSALKWARDIAKYSPDIPIVFVRTKSDIACPIPNDPRLATADAISAKTNANLRTPLVNLCERLVDSPMEWN